MEIPLEPAIAIVRGSIMQQVNNMPAQERSVRDYADRKHFDVRCVFEDPCKSAEKIQFLKREVAAKVLAYCREHGIRHIIMPNIDHAFRDVEDCRETIRILTYGESSNDLFAINVAGITGTAIHIVENGIDSRDEQCLLILEIRAKCAEEAFRKRSKWVKEAFVTLRKQNRRIGAVPYGWDAVPSARMSKTGRQGEDLVANDFEQHILARLLRGDLSASAGVSQNEAARRLNAAGIKTKHGKQWYGATVDCIRRTGRQAEGKKGSAEEAREAGNKKAKQKPTHLDSAQQETATPTYAQIHCPACSKILRLTLPLQGRLWNCPNCKTRFSVAFDSSGHMATHIQLPTNEPSLHRPWHEVLEVPTSASVAEIKTAFRETMKRNHPDKVAAMSHEFAKLADRKAKEINRAYEEALAKRAYT